MCVIINIIIIVVIVILEGRPGLHAGPKPVLRVVSFHADDTNRSPTFDMDLTELLQDGQPISYSQAMAYFKSDPATRSVGSTHSLHCCESCIGSRLQSCTWIPCGCLAFDMPSKPGLAWRRCASGCKNVPLALCLAIQLAHGITSSRLFNDAQFYAKSSSCISDNSSCTQ